VDLGEADQARVRAAAWSCIALLAYLS
jgi:hypothetical protein